MPAETVEVAAFPLGSYREAAKHMRRPFTPAAIKFKVQAAWPKDNPKEALIVSYMDARLVVERLNLLLPDKWSDPEYVEKGGLLVCRLTVDGITRQDIGEGAGKALYSDAFKRAAVKFGIGVSLYAVPKMILKDGNVRNVTSAAKKSLAMTSDGERTVRSIYETWLEEHGVKAFGEPLDHGDIEDAQGDYEAEAAAQPTEAATLSAERPLTPSELARVLAAVEDAKENIDLLLVGLGVEATDDLTTAHAFEIRTKLDAKAGR